MPHTCYTVFINHVGALPESEPVTLFQLADVEYTLHPISTRRDAASLRAKNEQHC